MKTVTIELEVDDKYNWVAVDSSGEVWVYEEEPVLNASEGMWNERNEDMSRCDILEARQYSRRWRESLKEI